MKILFVSSIAQVMDIGDCYPEKKSYIGKKSKLKLLKFDKSESIFMVYNSNMLLD